MEAEIQALLPTLGYPLLFLIIALESAGLPLPGETVLIAAAAYAGMGGQLDIAWIVALAAAAAILGDNAGFWAGRRFGAAAVLSYGRFLMVRPQHLESSARLFNAHGGKIVFFGRFVALLRMFAGPLAGAAGFGWRPFLVFNALGGVVWASGFGLLAFWFGDIVRKYASMASWAGLLAAAGAICGMVWISRATERAARRMID